MQNRKVIRSEDYVNREFIQVDLNYAIRDAANVLCQLFSIGQQMLTDDENYTPLYTELWQACSAIVEGTTLDDPAEVIK